jgi:EAL domain-containing protein (putative c-di-GMP-specific phosphodiesterase class I)
VLALLVDTAHALGPRLVAEGIETPEQLNRVQAPGCQSIKGYRFSRPLPAGQFRSYLQASIAEAVSFGVGEARSAR